MIMEFLNSVFEPEISMMLMIVFKSAMWSIGITVILFIVIAIVVCKDDNSNRIEPTLELIVFVTGVLTAIIGAFARLTTLLSAGIIILTVILKCFK